MATGGEAAERQGWPQLHCSVTRVREPGMPVAVAESYRKTQRRTLPIWHSLLTYT